MKPAAGQAELFAGTAQLPEGMVYETGFLTPQEEQAWVEVAASLPLKEMNYRGYTARRRVASYGGKYDFQARLRTAGGAGAPAREGGSLAGCRSPGIHSGPGGRVPRRHAARLAPRCA